MDNVDEDFHYSDVAQLNSDDFSDFFQFAHEIAVNKKVSQQLEALGLLYVKEKARNYKKLQFMNCLPIYADRVDSDKWGNVIKPSTDLIDKNEDLFIFKSMAIKKIVEQIKKISKVSVNTLITGETGTGKEIIAKKIHKFSPRSNSPFIAVNCSAIPDDLFESEMFGIQNGIATGVKSRKGHFELAHTGVLFLDEITEMSLRQQAKLLRAIETKSITRLGQSQPINIDIHLLAASNADIKQRISSKMFREDLFFRLNVINVHIPPLRERLEDIVPIAQYLINFHRYRMGFSPLRISEETKVAINKYPWPGNVRELGNEMERIAIMVQSNEVELVDLSPHIVNLSPHLSDINDKKNIFMKNMDIPSNLMKAQKIIIQRVLEMTDNNKSKAARLLGISREGLRKKMMRLT